MYKKLSFNDVWVLNIFKWKALYIIVFFVITAKSAYFEPDTMFCDSIDYTGDIIFTCNEVILVSEDVSEHEITKITPVLPWDISNVTVWINIKTNDSSYSTYYYSDENYRIINIKFLDTLYLQSISIMLVGDSIVWRDSSEIEVLDTGVIKSVDLFFHMEEESLKLVYNGPIWWISNIPNEIKNYIPIKNNINTYSLYGQKSDEIQVFNLRGRLIKRIHPGASIDFSRPSGVGIISDGKNGYKIMRIKR